MKFLVIIHDFTAPAGLLGERIVAHGGFFDVYYPLKKFGSAIPDSESDMPMRDGDYLGLIILGGPMDADDEDGFPHFRALFDLIATFERADKPILGLCLGAQLLARYHGAAIHRMTAKELGFVACRLLPEAADDPLLRDLPGEVRFLEWHQDRFDLPVAAVPLIAGDFCPHQAFRVGRKTYAFQAHPEVNIDIIHRWLYDGRKTLSVEERPRLRGIAADVARYQREAATCAALIFDRWIDLAEHG